MEMICYKSLEGDVYGHKTGLKLEEAKRVILYAQAVVNKHELSAAGKNYQISLVTD
jgi:hypothetical protein